MTETQDPKPSTQTPARLIPRETLTEEPQAVRLPTLLPLKYLVTKDLPLQLTMRELVILIESGLVAPRGFGLGEDGAVMTEDEVVEARTH